MLKVKNKFLSFYPHKCPYTLKINTICINYKDSKIYNLYYINHVMEFSIANKIPEFNSRDYAFEKFCFEDENKEYLRLDECKQALFFIFGKIIKKKILKEILSKKININNNTDYMHNISKSHFQILFNSIRQNIKLHEIDDYNLVLNFFDNLCRNEKEFGILDYDKFENKIYERFPLIKRSFLQEVFVQLDSDNRGYVKLSDLQKYLINFELNYLC